MATLRTLMLRTLSEGEPVTAVAMSRRWGEDRRRCEEWLEKFARVGVVRTRTVGIGGNGRKSRERGPVKLYVPHLPSVAAELARED